MAFAPIAAVVLAGGLLCRFAAGQLFVVALTPVALVVLAGSLLCLGFRHGGLHVFQAHHNAGGPFQQVSSHGLFAVHQQHAVAAGLAAACRRDQRRPFFHGLALVACKVHAALLHHPVEGRKAVIPLAGDLDLVCRDGCAVHIQTVAGEPCLDVLCALDTVHRGSHRHRPGTDEPPQHGAEHHQRAARRPCSQFFQARLAQCDHKHIPMPPRHLRLHTLPPAYAEKQDSMIKTPPVRACATDRGCLVSFTRYS